MWRREMRYARLARLAVLAAAWVFPTVVMAQTKQFQETVPLDAGGRLRLEGSKGSIKVTAWERDEVEIRARIEAPRNVSADYADRAVEAARVDVVATGDSVRVRSNYDDVPRSGWLVRDLPYIHFEIRAPRRLDVSVESDRGTMALTGFEGKISVDADRGAIDLRELIGDIRIVLDRGGDSSISSLRGSFVLEADRSDIRMRDVRIEDDCRLDIDRGDVEIDLEPTQALTVRADLTRRANFDSDFPAMLGSRRGRDFDAEINGGGPELFIKSDRGSIRLNAVH